MGETAVVWLIAIGLTVLALIMRYIISSVFNKAENAVENKFTESKFSKLDNREEYLADRYGISRGNNLPYNPQKPEVVSNQITQPQQTSSDTAWICPKCGWVNSAGQSDCIGCNMSITIPEELARKVTDNKPEPQAIIETTDNSKDTSKIYIRKTVKKSIVGIKRCPKCRELTASKYCSNCGTKIGK